MITIRHWPLLAATLLLSACGASTHYRPVSDVPVRIGRPYVVRGTTYVPAADPAYDRVGYASWYGPESGKQTANGERFRPDGISAAHPTLPLPSYVEVTDLDTGARIVVRVNDRGPFSGQGRLIDLSRGAGTLLGLRAKGVSPVRLRVVEPSETDRQRLRAGHPALARPRVSAPVLADLRAQLAREHGVVERGISPRD